MRRSMPNRKAPDIDVLARHYLARGLSRHPDIAKHVQDVEQLEKTGMWALLALAKKMRLNANELIRKTEEAERELSDYSFKYPGFKGELPFDLTTSLLGKSVTRKAKVVYEHTPEWQYYDLRKRALYIGWEGTTYHIEVAAVSEEHNRDDTVTEADPQWFQAEDLHRDGMLSEEAWEAIHDAIDAQCRAEDAKRRLAAAPPAGKA